MDAFPHQRRPLNRSQSEGDTPTKSGAFHPASQTSVHQGERGSPKQRRTTIASYVPGSEDRNGNFPEKDVDSQLVKPLGKLNTDEVCQWFTSLGLQKYLPFIREGKLCGADVASVDANTLDVLRVTNLEDREQLLAAIYHQLHPPTCFTQTLDSLLDSLGPNDVETFAATLASMSKTRSTPHVSCLSRSRRSFTLRNQNQNYLLQRHSQLMEISINASDRIVHLRTPKETTVEKIVESCIKMLAVTEDKSLFQLKETADSPEEIPADRQIGSLLTSQTTNGQLELHLSKKERLPGAENHPEVNGSDESITKLVRVNTPRAKEERIRELNQQVNSLQKVVLQVQKLHHDLVAFCSELKNMDGDDASADGLGSAELKQRLEVVRSRLSEKRRSLQALRDDPSDAPAHANKKLDLLLVEKMKMSCRVFKEEISMVHLNRQLAHLQNALQHRSVEEKRGKEGPTIGSLSQLVALMSPRSPAMLLIVQENPDPEGHYGFRCLHREGSGLEVVQVDKSHLGLGDRLVEVNGVPVVNSTVEELTEILLQGHAAQIVVLRQSPPTLPPPPTLSPTQHPLLLQHTVNPDAMPTSFLAWDTVTMGTPPQRKVLAI